MNFNLIISLKKLIYLYLCVTKQIEQKYAKETAELNPPHNFVPWVVINNQALKEVCD